MPKLVDTYEPDPKHRPNVIALEEIDLDVFIPMLAINLLGYMQKPDNNPTVVDIFCSCGGLSEGFHQGGYNVLLGIVCDRWSIRTYNRYHQERGRLKNVEDIDASFIFAETNTA